MSETGIKPREQRYVVKKSSIQAMLGSPIAFHRVFATVCKSAMAGLFLSQAYYWTGKSHKEDGWFYKTGIEWEEEVGMSRREIETSRRELKSLGLIEEDKRGVPCRVFYRVNLDCLMELIEQTSLYETSKLECTNPPNMYGGNEQTITENTQETTTKNTNNPSLNDFSLSNEQSNGKPKKHTRVLENTCDPRCKAVTAKIFEAYKYHNKVNPPWGAAEGKQLKSFLASHSDWSEEKIFECIRNRSKSEVNLAQEPLSWISKLGNYAGGPLDKFGNPKSNGNGFHNGQQSRTNGSGAAGHLLDHLPDAEEIARRRKADDARLEAKRNARGM